MSIFDDEEQTIGLRMMQELGIAESLPNLIVEIRGLKTSVPLRLIKNHLDRIDHRLERIEQALQIKPSTFPDANQILAKELDSTAERFVSVRDILLKNDAAEVLQDLSLDFKDVVSAMSVYVNVSVADRDKEPSV